MILVATAGLWEGRGILRGTPLLPFYASGLRRAYHGGYRTPSKRLGPALLCMGSGPRSVAEALDEFLDQAPRAPGESGIEFVIGAGYSQAVQEDLLAGDLVADVHGLDADWTEALRAAASGAGLALSFGRAAESDRVLTPAERRSWPGRAAVADTETAALRRWAEARRLPFLALRAVAEGLDDPLPRSLPARPGLWPALRMAAAQPGEAGALLGTWRRRSRAAASLGRLLRAFLDRM